MRTSRKLVTWMNDLISGILEATAVGEQITEDVQALEQELDTLRARVAELEKRAEGTDEDTSED